MRKLEHFWTALESVPTLTQPIRLWEEMLGPDYDFGFQFLRSTGRPAAWLPCANPRRLSCGRRVLLAAASGFVAVCGNEPKECASTPVAGQSLVLHELVVERLAKQVSRALDLKAAFESHPYVPTTWILGNATTGDESATVLLTIPDHRDELRGLLSEVLSTTNGPLIVATPKAHSHDFRMRQLVEGRGAALVGLDALLALEGEALVSVAPLARPAASVDLKAEAVPHAGPIIRKRGQHWDLKFKNQSVLLTAPYGPLYVVHLLLRPYQWVPVTELVRIRSRLAHLPTLGSAGGATDTIALRQYRRHLETIEAAMAVAEAEDNAREIKDLTEDKLLLGAHLASVVGYRGRIRIHSEDVERFRKSVAGALERTYKAIEEADHPLLAQHLRTFITMGRTLSYRPIPPVDWLQE